MVASSNNPDLITFVLEGESAGDFVRSTNSQLLYQTGILYEGVGDRITIAGSMAQLLQAGILGYAAASLGGGEQES